MRISDGSSDVCASDLGQSGLCAAAGGECLADSLASAQIDVPTAIDEPIVPLPLTLAFDPDRAALGEKLFHDRRLSHDGSLACVSCHNLAEGGDDGLQLPGRAEGRSGEMNTPPLLNSVLSSRLGRRKLARLHCSHY